MHLFNLARRLILEAYATPDSKMQDLEFCEIESINHKAATQWLYRMCMHKIEFTGAAEKVQSWQAAHSNPLTSRSLIVRGLTDSTTSPIPDTRPPCGTSTRKKSWRFQRAVRGHH